MTSPVNNVAAPALSDDARAQVLNNEVARLASLGYTVQTSANGQAVLSQKKRIGWFWNTVLSLLTAGLWLIVVIYKVVNRKTETVVVTVDQYGKISKRVS